GLARDCVDLAKATKTDSGVRDAAIIAGVQHIAHDRIAGYGCARSWVELLGFPQVGRPAAAGAHRGTEAGCGPVGLGRGDQQGGGGGRRGMNLRDTRRD
ncbi:MAG: DUF892 family protein, partial [Phycisphaerales bacterium]